MSHLKLLTIALAATLLTACEKREVFGENRITVKVVKVYLSSKSSSTVDLQDVKTNYLWRNQRLACNSSFARKVKIGSLWDVSEITYVYPESKRYTTALVGTPAICTKSK